MYKRILIVTVVVAIGLNSGVVFAQKTDDPANDAENTIDAILKQAIKGQAVEKKDEVKSADDKEQDKKKVVEKKPTDVGKTSSKPSKSTDDDELIRGLLPDLKLGGSESGEGDAQDELERAISAMREAGRKINDGDVSDETQAIQKSVLDDIDKLIEKLKNQPPPPKSNKNDNNKQDKNNQQNKQPQSQKPKPQQQPNQQQPNQQQDKQPENQQQSTDGGEQKSKSAESQEENQRKLQQARRAAARRRALINEVWGHLPPNVRERLLNVGGEKMLPKYEDRIRRYFESLAEGKKAKR